MKAIVVLMIVFCGSAAESQGLRQWMPNVGDIFIYERFDSSSGNGAYTSTTRLDTCRIISSDYFSDSTAPHTVTLHSSIAGDENYYFSNGDSGTLFPFQVKSDQTSSLGGQTYIVDFSKGETGTAVWNSDTMQTATAFDVRGLFAYSAYYSLSLKWFLSESHDVIDPFSGRVAYWSRDLFAAIRPLSKVSHPKSQTAMSVSSFGKEMTVFAELHREVVIALLDPVGRAIRTWQLTASDGPREITLNVADVPSGVYFLRLQGGGVDEVRKVLIR